MEEGRIRIEVTTPEGKTHVVEEPLPASTARLIQEAKRDPSPERRLKLFDHLIERGTALVMKLAAKISRGFRRTGHA